MLMNKIIEKSVLLGSAHMLRVDFRILLVLFPFRQPLCIGKGSAADFKMPSAK